MGKKRPVSIGNLEFHLQKDALAHFADILNRHEPGNELVGQEFVDVEALLHSHPRSLEKIGPGISSIVVGEAEYDGKCFHVVRKDGTADNFSYKKCISGDPP